MIDGMEILNQTEIMESYAWFSYAVLLIGIIAMISLIMFNKNKEMIWGIVLIISMIIMMVLVVLSYCLEKPTGRYIYDVTISDDVNFNEFNEKYEVIEQKGKIYTIKEK